MTDTQVGESLYEVLGVAETATDEDIRRGYARMVRKFRPDENPERYRLLNRARETLADPQKRREYDQMRQYGDQVKELTAEAEDVLETDPTKAVRLLKSAVVLAPELFQPRYLLAHALIGREDYTGAEVQLRRLLETSPENPHVHYNLGGCLRMLGQLDEAETALRQALILNPHYHDALILLSRVYVDKREIGRAVQCLEDAIRLNGMEDMGDLPVFLQLLSIHAMVENAPEFARTTQRIANIIQSSDDAHYALAKIYELAFEFSGAGNWTDAYKIIGAARHPRANDPKLLSAIAEATEKMGLHAEAVRAAADSRVPRTMQSYIIWRYLDPEGKLDASHRDIFNALEGELTSDVTRARTLIALLRSAYPRLAEGEAEFFAFIEERLVNREHQNGVPRGVGGGRVTVRPVERRKRKTSFAGCVVIFACAVVGQLMVHVPVVGFLVGLFIGAMIANWLGFMRE